MSKTNDDELLDQKIGNIKLREWETRWQILPNALLKPHPELRKKVGLLRFTPDGEIKYFVRATELKGGLNKGLIRLSGPDQTGNRSYGAQMIRKHIEELSVDVLIVGDSNDAVEHTKLIKRILNRLHNPEWSWPAKLRMELIRSGETPARP